MKQLLRLASAGVLAAAVAGSTLGAVAAPHAATNNGGSAYERADRSTPTSTLTTSSTSEAVDVLRVAGKDRIATAIVASQMWDDAGTPDGLIAGAVVLSRQDQYADALGGSALAGTVGGPLLLTPTQAIDSRTMAELDRVLGRTGPVYLLGGTAAISTSAEKSLRDRGYTVVRLAGADRFETSVRVATELGKFGPGGHPQFIFATTGMNFPDGLAAGATAAGYASAVVLTKDRTVPSVVRNYLKAQSAADVSSYAVGGAAARADYQWDGVFDGTDRYDTAALLARGLWGMAGPDDDPVAVALATGENWPDALAGGALIAGGGPLLLTQTSTFPAKTKSATVALAKSASPKSVQVGFVLGGTAVVSDGVMAAFKTALNS